MQRSWETDQRAAFFLRSFFSNLLLVSLPWLALVLFLALLLFDVWSKSFLPILVCFRVVGRDRTFLPATSTQLLWSWVILIFKGRRIYAYISPVGSDHSHGINPPRLVLISSDFVPPFLQLTSSFLVIETLVCWPYFEIIESAVLPWEPLTEICGIGNLVVRRHLEGWKFVTYWYWSMLRSSDAIR